MLRLAKLVAMALADHDLTDTQFRVLSFAIEGDVDMGEMCVRLVMKPPNLTAVIDGLVSRGLVERHRRPDDRRRVRLQATEAGRDLVRRATEDAERALTGLATLGTGTPSGRLDGLDAWSSAVETAAAMLRGDAGD